MVPALAATMLALVPMNLASSSALDPAAPGAARAEVELDSLRGRSGRVCMALVTGEADPRADLLTRLFGDSAAFTPGLYLLGDARRSQPFSFARLVPFASKRDGMLGRYRMGFWPAERRVVRPGYGNPDGFIRVTPEEQEARVSEHFRLRDFLTKDQPATWPKYLVLDLELVDKLELLFDVLAERGHAVSRLSVMSGFRTPQYNERGVGAGGRAQDSRHQYGDAADVFVDQDGDGRMDDLTGDGRVDARDAGYLAQLVEGVERRYPELAGGIGIYAATSAHGPFVHVDVRGTRARW